MKTSYACFFVQDCTAVRVPHTLDMAPYCSSHLERPNLKYDLVAITQHQGELASGHYTAHSKSALDGLWYKFDDADVSSAHRSQVSNPAETPYLLVYRLQE